MANIDSSKVEQVITDVGRSLVEGFGNIAHTKKEDNSVVTELDRKTEIFIAERLHKLHPEIEFVGEEFGGNYDAERFWLLDPIDGTEGFIRGIPVCSTMLCLIEDGQVVRSYIYDFVRDEMCTAVKGEGARCNGDPIRISDRDIDHSVIGWEVSEEKQGVFDVYGKIQQLKVGVFKVMSAGYEYMAVASGKLEGRICYKPYGGAYDYAPGALLVSEAGGIVRNIGSDAYDYTNFDFVAASPKMYQALRNAEIV